MTLQPDPSVIGGVPQAPLAMLPNPVSLFQGRARRFAFLAQSSELAPYLTFLAQLSNLQARLAATLPPLDASRPTGARAPGMPPIDRHALADDSVLADTLTALCAGAAELDMPEPARAALTAVSDAGLADRRWLVANVLSDAIPTDSPAVHLFAAAAVQVHLARLAARLDAAQLVPIRTGVCPSCGGRPVSSSVMGTPGIENVRYATCAGCATQWNEVRVKCLCCGSTEGISYQSADTHEATAKAEACNTCQHWVKIFYTVHNPSLDPVADDIGTLGLNLLMQDSAWRPGGFNPFLIGY